MQQNNCTRTGRNDPSTSIKISLLRAAVKKLFAKTCFKERLVGKIQTRLHLTLEQTAREVQE
jgi:hypothetical protein